MFLMNNKKALPRGRVSREPQLPSRKWVGCPDPSGPEEPVSQLPFLSTAPWARRAFVSGCVGCPPAASVCRSHAPLFPAKPALSQSEKKKTAFTRLTRVLGMLAAECFQLVCCCSKWRLWLIGPYVLGIEGSGPWQSRLHLPDRAGGACS